MLPSLAALPVTVIGAPAGRRPTLNQRMAALAKEEDPMQLRAWKQALKWARDRAPDHTVHVFETAQDGTVREREKLLFDDYSLSEASSYDDETLRKMLDFFVFAMEQYAAFL